MANVKVGKINHEPGYLYYLDGSGGVFRTPIRGHAGSKAKVGQVKKVEGARCWVAGNGDVVCQKR